MIEEAAVDGRKKNLSKGQKRCIVEFIRRKGFYQKFSDDELYDFFQTYKATDKQITQKKMRGGFKLRGIQTGHS